MMKIPTHHYLTIALIGILFFGHGCFKESALEPYPDLCGAEETMTLTVRNYADHHNREVQRLVLLDHQNKCLSRNLQGEFKNLVQKMETRNPEMAESKNRIQASMKWLPALKTLNHRGHPPWEIYSMLQHCLGEFAERTTVHSEISEGLDSAVHLLLARNNHRLSICLLKLQKLADMEGSQDEKCIVGVFLGSFERMLNKQTEQWYWPWIVLYDFMGSLVGGNNVGAIFSGWAELVFMEIPSGDADNHF